MAQPGHCCAAEEGVGQVVVATCPRSVTPPLAAAVAGNRPHARVHDLRPVGGGREVACRVDTFVRPVGSNRIVRLIGAVRQEPVNTAALSGR